MKISLVELISFKQSIRFLLDGDFNSLLDEIIQELLLEI